MPISTAPLTRRAFGLSLASAAAVAAQSKTSSEKWALLSDIHIPENPQEGYRGFSPVENLKTVLPKVLAANPAYSIINGDIAREKGRPGDYAAVHQIIEPLIQKVPVALAMGNHDNRENCLATFSAAVKNAQPVKQHHVLAFESNGIRYVVLDSLIRTNETPGYLGKAQRDWLASHLDADTAKPVVLFVHHTLDDEDMALLDAPRLLEIARTRKQVKAILYGHSHAYRFDVWEGIHLINIPAVGYNFKDSEPVGWTEAEFSTTGARFTLHAIGGNTQADGKTTEVQWRHA